MDILDSEASEDEAARRETPMNRPPSYEANQELIMKQQRYRTILTQATESDELVRRKWEEWEDQITELTRDEVQIVSSCTQFYTNIMHRMSLKLWSRHQPSP